MPPAWSSDINASSDWLITPQTGSIPFLLQWEVPLRPVTKASRSQARLMNVHTRAKTQKEVPRQTSTQTQSGAQIGAMLNRSDGVQASVSKAAVKAPAPPANQVNETAQTWLLTRLMPPSPHQSPD